VQLEKARKPRKRQAAEEVTTVLGAKVSVSSKGVVRIISDKKKPRMSS